ncbi:MAG: hypothetical protein ABSC36_06260 [Gaiellaceae bacterium]|jgi:hypothetical protein
MIAIAKIRSRRRMIGLALTALFTALVATGLVACGNVDRGLYVHANEQLAKQIPIYPGAVLTQETSSPYYKEDSEINPQVIGYLTRYEFKLPTGVKGTTVAAFYRHKLHWKLEGALVSAPSPTAAPGDKTIVLDFRHGKADVSINLENAYLHRMEIAVDHAFYGKQGR